MLIKELALRTGLSVHTLRYYEREGLLAERFIERGENNYRHYADGAVERIAAIKTLGSGGFTLAEIREFVALWDSGRITAKTAMDLLVKKEAEIDARIAELRKIKRILSTMFRPHVESAPA